MIRQLLVVFGMAAVGIPAFVKGQGEPYPYEDNQSEAAGEQGEAAGEQGEIGGDEEGGAVYEGEGAVDRAYGEKKPSEAGASADVSVDLAAPGASVTFETFHDALAPYGEWVTMPPYGLVWRPLKVQAGWRPYYYGHWEWSDEGWLWVSDEPWGWAPYHYGRWVVSPAYGWVWTPGYQWAPAWVSWRFSGGVVGWAPLLPGFSVYMSSYPGYYISYFTYVPFRRFVGVPVHSVAYAPRYAHRIFADTRPAPPRAIYRKGVVAPAWGGPARRFAEQQAGHRIAPARVVSVSSPNQIRTFSKRGVVPIYRPGSRPAPGWNRPRGPGISPRSAPGGHPGMAPRPMQPRGGYRGGPQPSGPRPGYPGGGKGYAPRPVRSQFGGAHGPDRSYRGGPMPGGAPRHHIQPGGNGFAPRGSQPMRGGGSGHSGSRRFRR